MTNDLTKAAGWWSTVFPAFDGATLGDANDLLPERAWLQLLSEAPPRRHVTQDEYVGRQLRSPRQPCRPGRNFRTTSVRRCASVRSLRSRTLRSRSSIAAHAAWCSGIEHLSTGWLLADNLLTIT